MICINYNHKEEDHESIGIIIVCNGNRGECDCHELLLDQNLVVKEKENA